MATPTPNPNSEKRSKESAGWITLPAEGREGPAPKLHGRHAARAKALWAHWWGSPMATMWGEFDAPVLERLLVLTARSWKGDATAAELSEVRQLEDRFGLSPQARRKLYWRVAGVDVPSTEPADLGGTPVTSVPSAGGAADPRLRVVQGGKAAV